MKKIILTSALCLALMACEGTKSEKVTAMQKSDKNLTCREVLLEQNEAEFYRATAEKNKDVNMRSVLMPLGYVSTYMSADEAAGAATAREEYLSRIYNIMGCDAKLQMADRKNKLLNRQMAETIDNSEDGTPNPAPVMQQPTPVAQAAIPAQPMMQMQAVPQSYVMPAQPAMRPQPMSYYPAQPIYYYQQPQVGPQQQEGQGSF